MFREEEVKPIIDADPAFYTEKGDSLLDSIARVSERGTNGELLGYGARHMLQRPAFAVTIMKGDVTLLYYFVSDPDAPLPPNSRQREPRILSKPLARTMCNLLWSDSIREGFRQFDIAPPKLSPARLWGVD